MKAPAKHSGTFERPSVALAAMVIAVTSIGCGVTVTPHPPPAATPAQQAAAVVNPGGVPISKNGLSVGGVGVVVAHGSYRMPPQPSAGPTPQGDLIAESASTLGSLTLAQVQSTEHPCTQGNQPANPNQNGVVFFAGGVPLFHNGNLAGGLGVSGDGVDQNDWVAAGGANGLQAPANIRADQVIIRDVRLPYQKFPRNPED